MKVYITSGFYNLIISNVYHCSPGKSGLSPNEYDDGELVTPAGQVLPGTARSTGKSGLSRNEYDDEEPVTPAGQVPPGTARSLANRDFLVMNTIMRNQSLLQDKFWQAQLAPLCIDYAFFIFNFIFTCNFMAGDGLEP
jgi:hypothetical protein